MLGRIYAKKFTNQKPEVIRDMDHLLSVARVPTYYHVTSQPRPDDRNSRGGSTNSRANTIIAAGRTMATGREAGDAGTDDVTTDDIPKAGERVTVATPVVANPGDTQQTSTPRDAHDVAEESADLDATMASESLRPPGGRPETSLLSGITVTNRYAAIETEALSDDSDTF